MDGGLCVPMHVGLLAGRRGLDWVGYGCMIEWMVYGRAGYFWGVGWWRGEELALAWFYLT